jgi:hypothetical protein
MVGGLGPGSLVRLAGVILGALALGAFYALPAVLDRGEILLSRQFQNASGYVLRGLRLSQFLTPGTSAGGGTIGPGAAFLLLGLLGWVGLHVGTRRREGGGHARFAAAVGVSAAASLVLASRSGAHLAHAIPALRFLQFPWRFQLTASLFLALAAGALADRGRVVRWRAAVLAVLGTATLIHGFAGGMPDRVALPTRAEFRALMGRYDWTGDVQNKYAPVLAVDAGSIGYRTDRERRAWFVRGEGSIRRVDNGIEHIRLGVRTLSPAWEVAIRRYYVSGWVATAERGIVGVEPDPATGLIRVRGSGDAGVVDLEYVGSRAYRWGIRLSAVAAVVVALLLCTGAWRDRRNRPVPARPGRPA